MTIVCPGPISTGSPDAPRVVYGAEGLISQPQHGSKGKVSPARCARLVADAAAHGVQEAWIAKHPVLLIGGPRPRPWLGRWARLEHPSVTARL